MAVVTLHYSLCIAYFDMKSASVPRLSYQVVYCFALPVYWVCWPNITVQDRKLFPINLSVVHLSGTGAESIFMGVIRSFTLKNDGLVKLWMLPSGMVLCCDEHLMDCFGINPKDLAGSSLGTVLKDQGAFDK